MPRAFSRKCGGCARLRRRIKRAGARPKPTPNVVEPGSASIRREAALKHYNVTTLQRFTIQRFRSLAFAHDPEAEVVAGKSRHIRAAHGCSQAIEARFPTAATINAPVAH